MGNVVINVAKGRLAYYASLPAATDALIVVPLLAAGLVSDATMVDYTTLSGLLAGASDEAAVGRKTLANVSVTVDQANDRVAIDADDVVWTSPGGGAVGAVVICYDPDTTTGTDADLIPLTKHDLTWTPDGSTFTLTITDLARCS